jgi:hypothetical protein
VTLVRERLTARAQTLDQGWEANHASVESYIGPVSVGSIDARPRICAQVWLWRLTRERVRGQRFGNTRNSLQLVRIENCCSGLEIIDNHV